MLEEQSLNLWADTYGSLYKIETNLSVPIIHLHLNTEFPPPVHLCKFPALQIKRVRWPALLVCKGTEQKTTIVLILDYLTVPT